MTSEQLQDYERLIEHGFTADQARSLIELNAKSSQTDAAVLASLERIEARLDDHGERLTRIESRLDGLETRMDRIETRMDSLETRIDGLEIRVVGIETRMASESRVFRVINTTLLAVGATLASLLAVFAR